MNDDDLANARAIQVEQLAAGAVVPFTSTLSTVLELRDGTSVEMPPGVELVLIDKRTRRWIPVTKEQAASPSEMQRLASQGFG